MGSIPVGAGSYAKAASGASATGWGSTGGRKAVRKGIVYRTLNRRHFL